MASPDFTATIIANGQRYSSWKSVMVRRDFCNGISTFQLSAAEPGPYGSGWSTMRLKPGDQVTILLGGQKVLTGYVSKRVTAYDAESHDLVVSGRSYPSVLKDSSVDVKPGNYDGSTFEQAARGVMAPHGVGLVMLNPPPIASKPFKTLSVQYGETCAEFIERIANQRGLILTDDADGNLVAGQGNPNEAPVADLVEGKNILRASAAIDDQTLGSKYQAVSQMPDPDAAQLPRAHSATAYNPNDTTSRIKLFIAEHPGDPEDLAQRVNHEVIRSMWPSVEVSITVVGWQRPDGQLWEPTKKITIKSPMLFPNESGSVPLGIQAVIFSQDAYNGTTTTLECKLPWLLTAAPDPGVNVDGQGNVIDDTKPAPAKPDQPDNFSGQI